MTTLRNKFYNSLGNVLGTAVADAGTFTVAYPTGTTVGDFDKGLADLAACYIVLNKNDKVLYGTTGDYYVGISFGASEITITNQTGAEFPVGTEVDLHFAVKEGNRRCVPIFLPPLVEWTAADIITEMQLGIAGDLEYAEFVTTTAVTTSGDGMTLNFEIGTTDVTGLTLALTSATVTPKGKVLGFGLPTAGYTLSRASKLSLEAATSVATFAEGNGYLNLYIREAALDQY
jgi:hypothetical protein